METIGFLIATLFAIWLFIRFWRFFVPATIVVGLSVAAFYGYEKYDEHRISQRLYDGIRADEDNTWAVRYDADPLTGKDIPYIARVNSDGGVCQLQVARTDFGDTKVVLLLSERVEIDTRYSQLARFSGSDNAAFVAFEPVKHVAGIDAVSVTYSEGTAPTSSLIADLSGNAVGAIAIRVKWSYPRFWGSEKTQNDWCRFDLTGAKDAIADVLNANRTGSAIASN